MPDLFDCTPRMAAKLARCADIARRQVALTGAQSNERSEWTAEDWGIFDHLRIATAYTNPIRGWHYMRNLNA